MLPKLNQCDTSDTQLVNGPNEPPADKLSVEKVTRRLPQESKAVDEDKIDEPSMDSNHEMRRRENREMSTHSPTFIFLPTLVAVSVSQKEGFLESSNSEFASQEEKAT
ncbi:28502_t:CDS:2, partial [Gigaspora margarita]